MAEKKPNAEEIFNKSGEEMNEIERMMADIMAKQSEQTAKPETPKKEAAAPVVAVPAPPEKKAVPVITKPQPEIVSERTAEIENDPTVPAISYTAETRVDRERKIKEEAKRRRIKPEAVLMLLTALLVVGSILFVNMVRDIRAAEAGPSPTPFVDPLEDIILPEPDPSPNEGPKSGETTAGSDAVIIFSHEEAAENNPDAVRSYNVIKSDMSWRDAKDAAQQMGGYLAVIRNAEELNQVTKLAEEAGAEKVWIGLHRIDGELVWETGEVINFYQWGEGEPSGFDSGDNVAEDYVLLWYHNGRWVYNDSRNDPAADYPEMYSGLLAYAVEFVS